MSYPNQQLPTVLISGRTNVGKSTLFNRLAEKNKALVSNQEGTTRDANKEKVEWRGQKFILIDSGGIIDLKHLGKEKEKINDIEAKVQKQARDLLERADLILFLVDAKTGLLPTDKQLALMLKKKLKNIQNVFLIANKCDSPRDRKEIFGFNKLSLGEPIPVSAANGSGTGDLLDKIIKKLPKGKRGGQAHNETINIGILGKPNVGKSSLINALIGQKKIIVSPIPHTTREPQDISLVYKNTTINLIDTAGISRKGQKSARQIKVKKSLQKLSIQKSLKILRRTDLALLVVDINAGISRQESKLAEKIIKTKTSLIIIANKWDLIKEKNTEKYKTLIYSHLPFAKWAPICFASALTGSKVKKIIELTMEIAAYRQQKISQKYLDKFLPRAIKHHPPAKGKNKKRPFLYNLEQTKTNPPQFKIRLGKKDNLDESYIRFIENRLREKFNFIGTPITIWIERKNKHTARGA